MRIIHLDKIDFDFGELGGGGGRIVFIKESQSMILGEYLGISPMLTRSQLKGRELAVAL